MAAGSQDLVSKGDAASPKSWGLPPGTTRDTAYATALATWLTGAWYLARSGNFQGSFALGMLSDPVNYYQFVIGIGAWLGTIMLFNVWVLIWPNQKKILGIVAATDEEKAAARKMAMLASRTNFVLSIPMLLCMGSATHGLPF